MTHTSTPENLAGTLQHLARHWAGRGEAGRAQGDAPHPLTVAIDREAGTPAADVARAIGARLGWVVYDHELLEQIAREMGLRTSLLESVDERRSDWRREAAEYFLSTPAATEGSYVRHLIETVLALGSHGECIIVGRGAAQVLPSATTLRVRLVAPWRERVHAEARNLHLPRHEVERRVEEADREHREFVREHFLRDPADPDHYDLVLNTARFSAEECAGLVAQALAILRARVDARAGEAVHA